MIVFILPQVDCTLITISSIWRDHRLQRVLPSQVQHEAEKRAMPAAIISIWRLTRKGLTITTRRRRSVNCWWRCCDKLNLLDKCIRWWGRQCCFVWLDYKVHCVVIGKKNCWRISTAMRRYLYPLSYLLPVSKLPLNNDDNNKMKTNYLTGLIRIGRRLTFAKIIIFSTVPQLFYEVKRCDGSWWSWPAGSDH